MYFLLLTGDNLHIFVHPVFSLNYYNYKSFSMKVSKVNHKGEWRIRIEIPYSPESTANLKKIYGARWSLSMKAWHIPYTQKSFGQLRDLFPDFEIETNTVPGIKNETENEQTEIKKTISDQEKPNPTKGNEELVRVRKTAINQPIMIDINSHYIYIKMPKNDTDILFLKSFKHVRWDMVHFCWVVPNYGNNREKILNYFANRNAEINELRLANDIQTEQRPGYTADEMLLISIPGKALKVYFAYNREIVKLIKKIPYCQWNHDENCWSVPYSERFIAEIKHIAVGNGLKLRFQEQAKQGIKPRTSRFDIKNYRSCPPDYLAKLRELRYSEHTLNTYKHMFEEFINHFPDTEPDDITDEMITDFLRYLVDKRNVSGSYQNQSINSIKFYYEKVMRGQRKIYLIDRPREAKYLPEVLSQNEIKLILKNTDNLKHKAIIMTIYSAGLRVSEAINLKLKDIDSQRMQIRVEQAKGKKDRYTLLSVKTLEILRKYVAEYKPKVWLFEGGDGKEYSRRSIGDFLHKAVLKSGIKKRVTVHTLRHSFATHLLEAGTDLRYIQNLLGHQNTKTTEIYTHITTKGFDQIVSPMDQLDI